MTAGCLFFVWLIVSVFWGRWWSTYLCSTKLSPANLQYSIPPTQGGYGDSKATDLAVCALIFQKIDSTRSTKLL